MVGNAHIDPVWLWQWPEGYQEVRATFQSAIDRMEEYPEFVFTSNSVCYLAWVEESDPELFEAIRKRVAEGRWEVIGGWWVEPDCNIPSGESFVRQALYGQRYLRDRFGLTATAGGNVDSFGHAATLPQLLRKSGLDAYVFLRPEPNELELPGPYFWWESPDGSRVLAYRIPNQYCTPAADLAAHVEEIAAELNEDRPELVMFYGVGNHGGGPTRVNLDSIRRLDGENGARLRCGPLREFFDRVADADDIPTWRGELQHHAVGCYSAHSGVKQWNRRAENVLLRAEKWAAIAELVTGIPYPRGELTEAWKLVLFNQFHDTLAGTAIAPAYEDARDQLGHASSLAATLFNRSVQSIARRIDIPAEPEMTPLVVFNAHPWPVRAEVEVEFAGYRDRDAVMRDELGEQIPVQRTRSLATVSGSRGRFVFPAELPPLGYRVYRLTPGSANGAGGPQATHTTLENAHIALEVDPTTGWLSRLVHKASGVDVVDGAGGAHAVVLDDPSDTWSHGVRAYEDVRGRFECASVRLVEQGPVRAVIRIESRFATSTLTEELVLGAFAEHVDVRVVLDWHERLAALKLRMPTAVDADSATFEVPYGHLERPANGDEEPAQRWVDVSDGRAGLSVLNDAKHGHDVREGTIGLTVARSPVYAWHDPRELEEDGVYEYLDQGRQQFTYRLVPHDGDWRRAGTVRLGEELNQPPFPLLESYHSGDLPRRATFAAADLGSVVPTVVKAGEDGGCLVVRAYESAGRPGRLSLDLPLVSRVLDADFGPHEVKTFRVPLDRDARIAEVDLLEW
jgi:alpha-mannosidase